MAKLVTDTKGRILTDSLGRKLSIGTKDILELRYATTSALNIALETSDGLPIEVEWGDGSVELLESQVMNELTEIVPIPLTTHNFTTAQSGKVKIKDWKRIIGFYTTSTSWNFNVMVFFKVPLRYFKTSGNNAIYGNLIAFKDIDKYFQITTINRFFGNLSYFSSLTMGFYMQRNSLSSFSGNLSNLSNIDWHEGTVVIIGTSGDFNFTGDFGNLKKAKRRIVTTSNTPMSYTSTEWETVPYSNNIMGEGLNISEVDNLIIDLSNANSFPTSGARVLDFRRNSAPSSASASAIIILQNAGFSVLTN